MTEFPTKPPDSELLIYQTEDGRAHPYTGPFGGGNGLAHPGGHGPTLSDNSIEHHPPSQKYFSGRGVGRSSNL